MTTIVFNAPPLLTATAAAVDPEQQEDHHLTTTASDGDADINGTIGDEEEADEVSQSQIVLEVVA